MVESKLRLVELSKSEGAPSLKDILKKDPELLAFFRFVKRRGLRARAAKLLGERMERDKRLLN